MVAAGHILILGGTTEGAAIRDSWPSDGPRLTYSRAGRVAAPATATPAPGAPEPDARGADITTRIGGYSQFGGLAVWIRDNHVTALIDATHPYAERISAAAAAACHATGIPGLRVSRPPWIDRGSSWHRAGDHAAAARLAADLGGNVLLTVGRQSVEAYTAIPAPTRVWHRVIEPTEASLPDRHRWLTSRGPFSLQSERELFARYGIGVLVTKNSGGEAVAAKLVAAAESGAAVVMIDRPAPAAYPLSEVTGLPEVMAWLHRMSTTTLSAKPFSDVASST